jgi:hypothetical membrane protein
VAEIAKIRTFHDKFPWLGPLIWFLTLQNFAATTFAAFNFKGGYDWANNSIIDLGNTACGLFNGSYVCSPAHAIVNLSFIALGLAMAFGALLIYQEFRENRGTLAGFICVGIAGIGAAIVGFFPENTIAWVHLLGASLPFAVGNAGIMVLGFYLSAPKWLRYYSFISGLVALVALAFLISGYHLGIGSGTIERITADPQIVWLVIFALYMFKNHYKTKIRKVFSGQVAGQ